MAVDEGDRFRLGRKLETLLGEQEAVTFMSALPPRGEELATKRDLDHLGLDLRREMAEMEARLLTAINNQTMTLLLGFLGSNLAFAVLILGLDRA